MGKKKTTEQYKAEVRNLVGDEYTVLGEYVNNYTKILMKHNSCGKEYLAAPNNFLSTGNRCPHCFGGNKKKSTEEFKTEVKNLVGDEYTVLGEYINNKTKILIKHNICGNIQNTLPNTFLKKHRCFQCSPINYSSKKKTTEEFKTEVKSLVGDEYTVLGEYINVSTKILMKHNICGKEYEIFPYSFLSGKRCNNCLGGCKKTTEQFKEEVKNLTGDEYTVLGEYINDRTKILIKHNICGKEYEAVPHNFLKTGKCPYCSGRAKKTTEQFKKEVKNLTGDEYTVLGEYSGANSKILMRHNVCEKEYLAIPSKFKNRRCPYCKISKGEKAVEAFLAENKINYISQKRFSDCKDAFSLPFDFYLPEKNIAIEYNGKQHYVAINYFGGEKQLHKQRHHDWLKRKYCQKNNITLITIRYDENIEEKLNKVII